MKIAIIADPEIAVPPVLYGGVERIIALLIDGLINQGHEVALFANPQSEIKGKLYPLPGKSSTQFYSIIKNIYYINKILYREKFDLVHSFGRLMYLLPHFPASLPKIMSYQREPTLARISQVMKLSKPASMIYTGCSDYIANQIKGIAPAFTIYNGVQLEKYTFQPTVKPDAPLIFLGRIEPSKGTHIAIEVAQRVNRKLIIAGNIPTEYLGYYNQKIKPHLSHQIQYVGPVDDTQKNMLLGVSFAFLMPILWNEPFGIVMAEAMACGTPVIGLNRGSVPEVIDSHKTGFICENIEEMVQAITQIQHLDRKEVRAIATARFSSETIVIDYINLYQKLLNKEIIYPN